MKNVKFQHQCLIPKALLLITIVHLLEKDVSSVDVLHLTKFPVAFMLTLNTQNNNRKSGCDPVQVLPGDCWPGIRDPRWEPMQAAFLGLLWQHIF